MAKGKWTPLELPAGIVDTEPVDVKEKVKPPARRIIAWDSEGMNLSGSCECVHHGHDGEICKGRPQHLVLFGCSAETDSPLVGKNIRTDEVLEYIINIGEKYPGAIHVAYSFKYDFNMIVKGLTDFQKIQLHTEGKVVIPNGLVHPRTYGYRWIVEYIPGKILRVSRMNLKTKKAVSVRIYDLFSFFARAFIAAAESILQDELSDEDREVIAHGKQDRGANTWDDIDSVRHYWEREITIMQRMTEKFRDIMYAAGLKLTSWYGPGAIASYLIKTRGLRDHIQNTPYVPEVHEASKWAYAGGRFEHFLLGRILPKKEGEKIYGLDINSAYPYALSNAPSLGVDHGEWVHVSRPDRIVDFGVYRVNFHGSRNLIEYRAMPLFHRDTAGGISFPGNVHGWYWSPEARVVKELGKRFGGVEILEGWEWHDDGSRPFKFLEEMYVKRQQLGKDNVISMPYKLGPNSMYGKFAQQVGFKEGKFGKPSLPPESHCLALAGWITSSCRASLYKMMVQIPPSELIAVETDGIFTTMSPDKFKHAVFGDALGEWEVSEYDEMIYLRNGIYHRRNGEEWSKPKSRGLDITSIPRNEVESYLQTCGPGDFPALTVPLKDRFTGMGAAIMGTPEGFRERHCRWVRGSREVVPGGNGKRIHVPKKCPACSAGRTAWDAPHPLAIHSNAGLKSPVMSQQHLLAWETKDLLPGVGKAKERERIESDYL